MIITSIMLFISTSSFAQLDIVDTETAQKERFEVLLESPKIGFSAATFQFYYVKTTGSYMLSLSPIDNQYFDIAYFKLGTSKEEAKKSLEYFQTTMEEMNDVWLKSTDGKEFRMRGGKVNLTFTYQIGSSSERINYGSLLRARIKKMLEVLDKFDPDKK